MPFIIRCQCIHSGISKVWWLPILLNGYDSSYLFWWLHCLSKTPFTLPLCALMCSPESFSNNCIFGAPSCSSGVSTFSKDHWLFLVENDIQKSISGHWICSMLLQCFCFQVLSSWQNLEACVYTCINTMSTHIEFCRRTFAVGVRFLQRNRTRNT